MTKQSARWPLLPAGQRPGWPQQLASFVVGCLVLAVLLFAALFQWVEPTYARLIVRLCMAVAGAGFAAFLLGYVKLDLPLGVKAGGPVGIFILLWLTNPGQHILPAVNQALQRCKENILKGAHDVAIAHCQTAVRELPDDYEPVLWLGQAQFYLGQYPLAVQSWTRALSLGADPSATNYGMGLAFLNLKKFDDARQAAIAAAAATSDPAMLARIWYLEADAHKGLWDFGKGSSDHFDGAVKKYAEFLTVGFPKYRAQAELACLFAKKGELATESSERDTYDDKAVSYFGEALNEIRNYNVPDKSVAEKASFVRAYKQGGKDECAPILASLWERHEPGQDYDAMVSSVSS
jgi:tetratricopeptide (TPR) repeat protein